MNRRTTILLLLLPLLVAASADGPGTIEKALRDLESPFFEARRRAVLDLAGAGRKGEAAMRGAYPKADFRTKTLILDGFVRGHPAGGIALVYDDLDTPDRGVVLAQRRLVSAHYLSVARYAMEIVAPRVDRWEWLLHEGLRALPGPGETPRAVLEALGESKDPILRAAAKTLAIEVGEVTRLRKRLAKVASESSGRKAERARTLLARLLRHDTERALLSVFEVSGREGSFEGMFATVGELVTPRKLGGTPGAVAVLMAILRDRPLAEEGIPADARQGYRFLSPLPPDGEPLTLRVAAANCLGDVGDAIVGAQLAEYFEEIGWNSVKGLDDPEDRLISDGTTPKLEVACACAGLGLRKPLEKRAKYLEGQMSRWWTSSLERRTLAHVYARLGEHGKAARQYEYCLQETPRDGVLWYNLACARSRAGNLSGAMTALRRAVGSGYGADPSQVYWARRDRDLNPVRDRPGFDELFGPADAGNRKPERAR